MVSLPTTVDCSKPSKSAGAHEGAHDEALQPPKQVAVLGRRGRRNDAVLVGVVINDGRVR
eukprot:scaffold6952_cov75-Phaeocystis_antarctica.AAC.2